MAYMDGITGSPTLGGVVLATISGAAYAVFKVSKLLFKLKNVSKSVNFVKICRRKRNESKVSSILFNCLFAGDV